MRLIEMEIRNVRQIRQLRHKFSAGITGILGPNGSGKSNLLRTIRANLTGDWGSDSLKERNVCRWSTSKDASFSRGTWQHNETRFELVRGLQKMLKQQLDAGGSPLVKAKEVTAALERILGFSLAYAFEHLFVPQWKIFEFMAVKPEDRLKALARLCHVDDLESLWALLGDRIATDQKLVVQIDETALITNRQRYEDFCKRLQNLVAELNDIALSTLPRPQRKQHRLVVKIYEQQRTDRRLLNDVAKRYRADKATFAAHSESLKRVTSRLNGLRADIAARQSEKEEASQQLNEVALQLQLRKQAESYRSVLQWSPPVSPVKPPDYQETAAARVRMESLAQERKDLTSEIATLREAPDSCPTCGHDWEHAKSHLSEKEARLLKVLELQRPFQNMTKWRAYEGALLDYQRQQAAYETQRKAAEAWLRDNPVPELKELHERRDSAAAVLRELEELEAQDRQLDKEYYSQHNAVKSLRLKLIDGQKQGRELIAKLQQTLNESREQYLAARQALRLDQQARADYAAKQELHMQLTQEAEALAEQIQQTERRQQQTAHVEEWLKDLTDYRAVVHRDQLPQIAMRAYLTDVVERVNEYLEAFDNPFTVAVAADLSLLVEHQDGHLEPVSELSGGQKVVLAIAYHLTVNEHDFLALDEPTAGLDRTNLDYLAEALLHLRGVAHKEGRQILLVTHDDRLERVFDDVIRLERPKDL